MLDSDLENNKDKALPFQETVYDGPLGDELRGARISIGKTLKNVQEDLRIRAEFIDAIECGQLGKLPSVAYASGYVRSYARYLGLDPESTWRRFAFEAGLINSSRQSPALVSEHNLMAGYAASVESEEAGSRIVVALGIVLGIALLGVVFFSLGLLLEKIQKIPLQGSDANKVTQESSASLDSMQENKGDSSPSAERADPAIYDPQKGVLGSLYTPPKIQSRDGPISAIVSPLSSAASLEAKKIPSAESMVAARSLAAEEKYGLKAVATSWIHLTTAAGTIVFSGVLSPGRVVALPESEELFLHTGNAGGLVLAVEGQLRGPLGRQGQVIRDIRLIKPEIATHYGVFVDPVPASPISGAAPVQRNLSAE